MSLFCRLLIVATLALSAVRAGAVDHPDYFDSARKPIVTFDKKTMTWTLRNQAIERVIHLDTKTGALNTVVLRDLQHKREITPTGSEGEISFIAPIMEPPAPLVEEWKYTDAAPPADWIQPGFPAAGWKSYDEKRLTSGGSTRWFRCQIPSDRMQTGHAYALILDNDIDNPRTSLDIYIDGTLAAKVGPSYPRLVQLDLLPKNRVIAIKNVGAPLVPVFIAEIGTAPPSLDLKSNWQYALHAVNIGENDSQILTISLSGVKQYEGFDINVNYQIFPGDEPFMAKWFDFNSHRLNHFLMEQVTYDRWPLPAPKSDIFQSAQANCFAASEPGGRNGIMTATLSPMGMNLLHSEDNTVAVIARPYFLLKQNTFFMTPKSLIGLYHGPPATGAFLHQLYIGEYVARGAGSGVPPVYGTGFGYGAQISAPVCKKIIPLAADLGVKIFVLDNGWQTNITPKSGSIGDWVTDRSPDKFPEGLLPISTLARERNMRFGLWLNATAVDPRSQAATTRKEWLIHSVLSLSGDITQTQMCFTSGWAENFTESTRELCHELSVTYLKLQGDLLEDDCFAPLHDHPIGHSRAEEISHWADMSVELHKLDPNFAFSYEQTHDDYAAELLGQQDVYESRFLGLLGTTHSIVDATPVPESWYENAELRRLYLSALAQTLPSFALMAVAPCHLPLGKPDLNALEFNLTTGCACVGNVELQGKLDDMTPEEQALVQKWVKWNQDNRSWLAYAQPLDSRPDAATPTPGILHLRNALDGRYGYICLWNASDQPNMANVSFQPADYFVRMKTEETDILSVKDGKPVKFSVHEGAIVLKDVPLAPRSWEIFEIRQRGK